MTCQGMTVCYDVILFQQRENKQLRDSVLRLEEENCNLAQEVVESKVELRSQMDKVRSPVHMSMCTVPQPSISS